MSATPFLKKTIQALTYPSNALYLHISSSHLRHITAIGWKNTNHIRKIHVSTLLIDRQFLYHLYVVIKMTSKKNLTLCAGLAVIGGVIFSQLPVPPALSFVIGVVATAFLFSLSSKTPVIQPSDSDPSTKTLYVGNLPYKANESHVRDLFAEYGQVYAVRLMKDKRTGKRRGFGFVVMAAADAKPALAKLNEKEYMERTLKVRIANDPKHPEGGKLEQD